MHRTRTSRHYCSLVSTRSSTYLQKTSTKEIIPNKFVTKWRFECYDVTDSNNPSDVSIWERGYREAKIVMHFMEQRKTELVVVRNEAKGSNTTTYLIYPK
ncbi:MAG: hypothetical protein WAM14_22125 [Candidatus Nitrosopolaris sp.]